MASLDKIRRILQLLERLQTGRLYNAGDLAEFCGVSRRTTFRDLQILQQSGVSVLYDAQRRGYFMPGPSYLPPTDLTMPEALALMIAAHEVGRASTGVPMLEAAQSAALKVFSNLSGPLRTHLSEVCPRIEVRLEPHHPMSEARLHYGRVQQALMLKRRIRLEYDSLHERAVIKTLVSPYALLFSRRSWYVIGRSSLHRSVRTFDVGRIRAAELTEDAYAIPTGFSVSRHLGQAWRLIREPKERAEVVVRFAPLVAKNVSEVAWHPSQKLSWNEDGSLDYRVVVEGLREISWWILGYGDQAEVLAPVALRDMIAERVDRMHAAYTRPAPSLGDSQ